MALLAVTDDCATVVDDAADSVNDPFTWTRAAVNALARPLMAVTMFWTVANSVELRPPDGAGDGALGIGERQAMVAQPHKGVQHGADGRRHMARLLPSGDGSHRDLAVAPKMIHPFIARPDCGDQTASFRPRQLRAWTHPSFSFRHRRRFRHQKGGAQHSIMGDKSHPLGIVKLKSTTTKCGM